MLVQHSSDKMGARTSRTTDAYDKGRAEHQRELGCFGVLSRVVRWHSLCSKWRSCLSSSTWLHDVQHLLSGLLFELACFTNVRLCVLSQLSIKELPVTQKHACMVACGCLHANAQSTLQADNVGQHA